jgi:SpoU rRNA methylase family enzyme
LDSVHALEFESAANVVSLPLQRLLTASHSGVPFSRDSEEAVALANLFTAIEVSSLPALRAAFTTFTVDLLKMQQLPLLRPLSTAALKAVLELDEITTSGPTEGSTKTPTGSDPLGMKTRSYIEELAMSANEGTGDGTARALRAPSRTVLHADFQAAAEAVKRLSDVTLSADAPTETELDITFSSPGTPGDPSSGIILTPTTRTNLFRIQSAASSGIPILLEGPTGVGKSALVVEAARRAGKEILRFNLSSKVTIADFFGKVVITGNSKQPFFMSKGAFTEAFEKGYYLLLDEVCTIVPTTLF